MNPAGLLVVAILAGLLAFLPKLRRLVSGNPALRKLVIGCGTLAGALVVQLPPVYPVINRAAGFNLAWPVQHVLVVVAAWCCQAFFLYSIEPDRRTARGVAIRAIPLVGAIVAMVVLFAMAHDAIDFVYGPRGRTEHGGTGDPIAAWAFIVFSVYLGYVVFTLMLLAGRWSTKAAELPWLRAGLRLAAIGCGVGTVFSAHKLVFQIALLNGITLPWAEASVGNILMPISCALCLAGVSSGIFGSRLGARIGRVAAIPLRPVSPLWTESVQWWRRYTARRALYPLWRRIHEAMPGLALDPPRSAVADWLRVRDARFHLYRFVIEIWDALRHLRPLVPPVSLALARDSGEPDADAIEAAVVIVVGLREWASGPTSLPLATASLPIGSDDLAAEVAWLRQVARAVEHSPIVANALSPEARQSAQSPQESETPHR
jgi:hypothetical protein